MEIITKFIELRIFGFTANQTVVVWIGVVIYMKQASIFNGKIEKGNLAF